MRSAVPLASGPGLSLNAVVCVDDHRDWSAPALSSADHRLVLIRRGRFRRRSHGVDADLDATMGYLSLPSEEERFSHPCGGDLCTSLAMSTELWHRLAGEGPHLPTFYVDGRLELAHRRLLRAAQAGDVQFALVEALLGLLEHTLRQTASGPTPAGRRRTVAPSRLVDRAREALLEDHPAAHGLLPLADHLGASPFRLSRAFTLTLGVSLTHYRNRVRVSRALDRLEAGEPSLALLAADLGFADQAHLTRTIRRHSGHTPTALRRLLEIPG